MNCFPIVTRELIVASRKPITHWLRPCAAAIAVALLFVVMITESRSGDFASVGKWLFGLLSTIAFIYSLLAGVFLTSDSLSSERRSGTLGLLFLTDLHSRDVVLGKLAGSCLPAIYGLLAIFPVLGLPLVLGGVSGGEFIRVSLILLLTLLFSLATGIMISALVRESRTASLLTFGITGVMAGAIPGAFIFLMVLAMRSFADYLLVSPAMAFFLAFDSHRAGRGAHFWIMAVCILVVTIGFVAIACSLLTRRWRDLDCDNSKGRNTLWSRIRNRLLPQSGGRTRLSDGDPFLWLGLRDRSNEYLAKKASLLVLPQVIWFLVTSIIGFSTISKHLGNVAWGVAVWLSFFAAFGAHLIVKYLFAFSASRMLSEDRATGALELILASPASDSVILKGYRLALFRQFATPVKTLILANILVAFMSAMFSASLDISQKDVKVFVGIFVGAGLAMAADAWAMSWFAPWRALRSKNQNRAVVATLGCVLGLSWLTLFIVIFSLVRGGGWNEFKAILMWLVIGIAIDVVAGLIARKKLEPGLRVILQH